MIKKIAKKIATEIYLCLKEKTYKANGTRLKYVEFNGGGQNALVIIFSAYNSEKALYNYIRTLKNVGTYRIYIKDDFAPDGKGSYYLGEKGLHNVEKTVLELIRYKIKEKGMGQNPKLIFVGSSKGGYAALNFAAEFDNSYAIVGAPQYLLGSHLNEDFFYPMLEDIIGERTEEKIEGLDNHIRNKYLNNRDKLNQNVFLQYSDKEYTFNDHIVYLIEDLKRTSTNVHLECLDYHEHSEVHKFFPAYLCRCIENILRE